MKKKVLIVEDNLDLLDMYKFKFESEWFIVEWCTDWFKAVQTAIDFKPDVILLDIMMPNMNWFETLKVIRQQTSVNTKIVMFSNLSNQKDIDKCLQMGADDYIIKSDVTPSQAVEKVKKLLWIQNTEEWENENNNSISINCPHCNKPIKISLDIQ